MADRFTYTVALALGTIALAGPVLAQDINVDNLTRIEQEGSDNSASIDQSGASNDAGTLVQPMFQQGFENILTILQSGNANSVGTTGAAVLQRNVVRGVPGANMARIEQDGDTNRVDEVFQQITGPVPGDGNRLEVYQNGGAGTGLNVVGLVRQTQREGMPGQSALILMDGTGNRIEQVLQDSLSSLRGEENRIEVRITGTNNGTQALRGVSQLPGLSASHLVQSAGTEDTLANGNVMTLEIQANGTAFSIRQRGRGNLTGPVVLTGDGNSVGIDQDGLDNELAVGLIEGTDNEIGLSQFGTNRALLSLLGESDRNSVLVDQMGTNVGTIQVEGDSNILNVLQGYLSGAGGTNLAELTVIGDANQSDVRQEGVENSVNLTIEGDANNLAPSFAAPGMPAGLTPGQIVQLGTRNTLTTEVEGNGNLGAALQQGTLNAILLSVVGDDNEALLRQIGSGNTAGLSQIGRGNVAVFLQ